jgi:hypothetical protein
MRNQHRFGSGFSRLTMVSKTVTAPRCCVSAQRGQMRRCTRSASGFSRQAGTGPTDSAGPYFPKGRNAAGGGLGAALASGQMRTRNRYGTGFSRLIIAGLGPEGLKDCAGKCGPVCHTGPASVASPSLLLVPRVSKYVRANADPY